MNLRFKAKTAEDLDGLKERVCPKCPASARGRLRHLDFVLDRLPPYLVVSWEFDVLAKRVRDSIFDDLDITVSNPWRQDPETRAYRWAGLVQHESRNHFRLYWRRDETSAWSYDGFAQGLTTVPM